MPILKSFLKDKNGSGADAYKNVDINFIRGRKAILTIYDVPDNGEDNKEGWIEKEQLVLSEYKTKDEMHALMVEKGFELKSEFEREVSRRLWEWNREQNDKVEEDEMMMMRQKFAEELLKEKGGDEL